MMIRGSPIIYPDPVRHKIYMSDDLKDLISKVRSIYLVILNVVTGQRSYKETWI